LLKALVRGSALCLVAVVLLGVYMQSAVKFSQQSSSGELGSAGLAMQFARTVDDAQRIMPASSDRTAMAKLQQIDFPLIGLYWSLFTLLSVLVAKRNLPGSRGLAAATCLCATLVAWLDIREDRAILNVINAFNTLDDDLVAQVSRLSHSKWAVAFLTTLLLAVLFLPRRDLNSWTGKLSSLAGVALVTSAVTGWIGLANHHFIPIAMRIMAPGMLLIIGLFVFASDAFVGGGHFRTSKVRVP
jgi:hypothetical protein